MYLTDALHQRLFGCLSTRRFSAWHSLMRSGPRQTEPLAACRLGRHRTVFSLSLPPVPFSDGHRCVHFDLFPLLSTIFCWSWSKGNRARPQDARQCFTAVTSDHPLKISSTSSALPSQSTYDAYPPGSDLVASELPIDIHCLPPRPLAPSSVTFLAHVHQLPRHTGCTITQYLYPYLCLHTIRVNFITARKNLSWGSSSHTCAREDEIHEKKDDNKNE